MKADFYKSMQDAKALKRKKLEQERLAAEFQVHPERFEEPYQKAEHEVKLDQAFTQLQIKLGTCPPNKVQAALDHLTRKIDGV